MTMMMTTASARNPLPRIFVGHLARPVRPEDLRDLFSAYPDVRDVSLKEGFGFVEFENVESAEKASKEFNGKEFFGESLLVEMARGTRSERGETREALRRDPRTIRGYAVLVANCPEISWQELKDYFRQCGRVTYAETYPERREGIVEFGDRKDMHEAIHQMNRTVLGRREIYVTEFFPDNVSSTSANDTQPISPGASGGRYFSRSRSPSRSHHARRREDEGRFGNGRPTSYEARGRSRDRPSRYSDSTSWKDNSPSSSFYRAAEGSRSRRGEPKLMDSAYSVARPDLFNKNGRSSTRDRSSRSRSRSSRSRSYSPSSNSSNSRHDHDHDHDHHRHHHHRHHHHHHHHHGGRKPSLSPQEDQPNLSVALGKDNGAEHRHGYGRRSSNAEPRHSRSRSPYSRHAPNGSRGNGEREGFSRDHHHHSGRERPSGKSQHQVLDGDARKTSYSYSESSAYPRKQHFRRPV